MPQNMRHTIEGLRFGGLLVMLVGAWLHRPFKGEVVVTAFATGVESRTIPMACMVS